MEPIELIVSGMSCDTCADHVEQALVQVRGVGSARVDLASGRAVVEGEGVDRNKLVEAVAQAGYGVRV